MKINHLLIHIGCAIALYACGWFVGHTNTRSECIKEWTKDTKALWGRIHVLEAEIYHRDTEIEVTRSLADTRYSESAACWDVVKELRANFARVDKYSKELEKQLQCLIESTGRPNQIRSAACTTNP
jgi:hypothetical protein